MAIPQTSFTEDVTAAFAGMVVKADQVDCYYNAEASAEIAFGRAVMQGTLENEALLPVTEDAVIVGIVCHSHAYSNDTNGNLGTTGVVADAKLNVLRKGIIWAVAEDGCAIGDRLWVRGVGTTPPEYLGGLTNADDSTDTVNCTNQGVWRSTASAGGLAKLEVDFTNKPGI